MTYQQSVNTKSIAFSPSSLFFVIIKRDFITDYLNVPAFSQNFWFELTVLYHYYGTDTDTVLPHLLSCGQWCLRLTTAAQGERFVDADVLASFELFTVWLKNFMIYLVHCYNATIMVHTGMMVFWGGNLPWRFLFFFHPVVSSP